MSGGFSRIDKVLVVVKKSAERSEPMELVGDRASGDGTPLILCVFVLFWV